MVSVYSCINMQLIEAPIAQCFQSLTDPVRLRIVRLLATTKEEACLCELVDSLLEPKYKLSKALKILRASGFLLGEKDGRWVYHRLAERPKHLVSLLEVIAEVPDDNLIYAADLSRFRARLNFRQNGRCRVTSVHNNVDPINPE